MINKPSKTTMFHDVELTGVIFVVQEHFILGELVHFQNVFLVLDNAHVVRVSKCWCKICFCNNFPSNEHNWKMRGKNLEIEANF